jgi:signal transduction histidine kinase
MRDKTKEQLMEELEAMRRRVAELEASGPGRIRSEHYGTEHARRLEKLAELGMTLSGEPLEVFERIARMIGELLGVRVVCLSEIRGDELWFLSTYVNGTVTRDAGHCPLKVTPCVTVEQARDMRIYDNVAERFPEAVFLKEHNASFYCGFPSLDSSGNVAVVTCLLDSRHHDLSDEEKNLLRIFAERIGIEIERKKDLIERRRMEEELLNARRLESIGILAGGIAHDYNNLLTGILGNISLVKHLLKSDKKVYGLLVQAEKASLRAKDLTQRLLTFSEGGGPVKKTMFIGQLLCDSVDFALSGSNVKCTFSIPDDLWAVEVDEGQMNQAIQNLVINAQQAMPEGGVLKLTAENCTVPGKDNLPLLDGRYVKVTVDDQGPGIPKELLPKIFDPYFTTKEMGSGLGLATTYSIIKKHGGYISVESETGVGTIFNIYLPVSIQD